MIDLPACRKKSARPDSSRRSDTGRYRRWLYRSLWPPTKADNPILGKVGHRNTDFRVGLYHPLLACRSPAGAGAVRWLNRAVFPGWLVPQADCPRMAFGYASTSVLMAFSSCRSGGSDREWPLGIMRIEPARRAVCCPRRLRIATNNSGCSIDLRLPWRSPVPGPVRSNGNSLPRYRLPA